MNYPLIGDPELKVVKAYDMLPADAGDTSAGRTPADNATARSVFVIGPGQADQGDADLSDEHRAQLRRDPAAARLVPAHGARRRWRRPPTGSRATTSSSCRRSPTPRHARTTRTAGSRRCPTSASSRSRSRRGVLALRAFFRPARRACPVVLTEYARPSR